MLQKELIACLLFMRKEKWGVKVKREEEVTTDKLVMIKIKNLGNFYLNYEIS